MERPLRTEAEANQLVQLGKVLNETIDTVVNEWALERNGQAGENAKKLPSWRLHEGQRTILAIAGTLTELLSEPSNRLQEFASQFWEARAFSVAIERRIPDLLSEVDDDGMDVIDIAEKTGIEHHKLSRIMRCLCSNHIFRQTGNERFANNRISSAIVQDEEFRAHLLTYHLDVYSVSDRFPKYLLGPKGASYDVTETSFQDAMGTSKPRWDWLAERVSPNDISRDCTGYPGVPDAKNWPNLKTDTNGMVTRPELENFSLAMVGGGRVSGAAHPYDFPWGDLPHGAKVVDVGGGMGGFVMQLLSSYPHLDYIVEDRAEVIQQAQEQYWPKVAPEMLKSRHVTFLSHDFFEPNPIQGADIYILRGVLHDWSDSYCIQILSALREAMTEESRLLICDQVMNTTFGCEEIDAAPNPLPANFGYFTRYSHSRDLAIMACINGIERTPQQFKEIIEKAELKLERVRETRSVFGMVEVRK